MEAALSVDVESILSAKAVEVLLDRNAMVCTPIYA